MRAWWTGDVTLVQSVVEPVLVALTVSVIARSMSMTHVASPYTWSIRTIRVTSGITLWSVVARKTIAFTSIVYGIALVAQKPIILCIGRTSTSVLSRGRHGTGPMFAHAIGTVGPIERCPVASTHTLVKAGTMLTRNE